MNGLGGFLGGFRVGQVMPKPDPDFTGPGSGREVPDPKPERVSQQGPQPDPTLTDDKSKPDLPDPARPAPGARG